MNEFSVNIKKLEKFINMSKEEQYKDIEEWMLKNNLYDAWDMELAEVEK